MKKKLIFLLILILLPAGVFAELVFLKDGSIIKGKILSETASTVVIRNDKGKVKRIPYGKIMRTLYTEIYLGKQLVRLTTGRSFEAYVVYENRKKYVFRYKLNEPEEFEIPRDKVLYLSRNNPTELDGRPDETSVRLTWNAPYSPPAKYAIYYRYAGVGKWKKAGESHNTSYEMKNLKKKTTYQFMVKGVDKEGKESLPTNVLVIKTNIPPSKPRKVAVIEKKSAGGKEMTVNMKWKPATDEDGGVTHYVIYEVDENRLKKRGETRNTSFSIRNLDPEKKYRFHVAAVDNDNTSSELPDLRPRHRFGLMLYGHYNMLLTKNMDNVKNGISVTLHADYQFFIRNGFILSAVVGTSFTLHGNKKGTADEKNLIPLGFWGGLGVGYEVTRWLSLNLKVMGGYMLSILDNRTSNEQTRSNDLGLNPMFEANFFIGERLVLSVNLGYLGIFYKENMLHDMQFGAGVGVRL